MENFASQYQEHIKTLQQRTQNVLKNNKLNALLIHSGEPKIVFLDDYHYPFKANPHFKAWLPITQVAHCWLLVDGVSKPKLWFYSPIDYWHSIDPLPDSFWLKEFELFHLSYRVKSRKKFALISGIQPSKPCQLADSTKSPIHRDYAALTGLKGLISTPS